MNIMESMIADNRASHITTDAEGNVVEVYARPKCVEQSLADKLSAGDVIRGGAIVGQSCKFNQIKANLYTRCMGTNCKNKCKGLRTLPTGNTDTQVMFINRQPTDYETIMSASCSDRCGVFISLILDKMGTKRDSVYFTDMVKCNVQVDAESCYTCIDTYLQQEIDLVNPKLIICNGLSALKMCAARNILMDLPTTVSYGNIYTVRLPNGNSAKVTAIYDLETVLKKDGDNYSKCKNELWMQITNAFKSII
jgi:DNA polymerase